MSFLNNCYTFVSHLNDILCNIGIDGTSDPEWLLFTSKTVVATNCTWEELANAIFAKSNHTSFGELIAAYMVWHKNKSAIRSRIMFSADTVRAYLNSTNMKLLFTLVGPGFFEFLVMNCDFYENLNEDGLSECFQQKFGLLLSRHAWNKTEFAKKAEQKVEQSENLKACLSLIKWNPNANQQQCEAENNVEPKVCATPKHNHRPYVINRNSILYAKAIKGKFLKNALFYRNDSPFKATDLVNLIFTEPQRQLIQVDRILPLLEMVIKRHSVCHYKNLVKSSCRINPSQISDKQSLKYCSSQFDVCSFIRSVFVYIFPKQLLGKHGHSKICHGLKLLVKCGNKVSLKLSNLRGTNFNVSEIEWLTGVACETKRLLIFDSLLKWIVTYFLNLLKSFFYVTETGVTKMELCFFRHDVWLQLVEEEVSDLIRDGRISESNINSEKKHESFKLRLLPKSRGFRKLVYRKQSKSSSSSSQSASTVKNLLSVLREIRLLKNWRNASAAQLHDVMRALKECSVDKVYWFKADISQCFSSINQHKLLFLVCERLDECFAGHQVITIRECEMVTSIGKRLISKRVRYIAESKSTYYEMIHNKECVIIDSKFEMKISLEMIKQQLADYVIVPLLNCRETGKQYAMKVGIREGGPLSSELCAIYVNVMLEHYFKDLGMLRWETMLVQTDDIVFITTDQSRYESAVEILNNGFQTFDVSINHEKLVFNPQVNGCQFNEELLFDGRHFKFEPMRCRTDYSHYANKNIEYSFACNPFASLKEIWSKVVSHVAIGLSYVDLDCIINDEADVALNLFEKFTLQAYRLNAYFKLSPISSGQHSPKYLVKLVFAISRRVWYLAQKWSGVVDFTLSEADLQFICLTAMKRVWAKCASHRGSELSALRKSLQYVRGQIAPLKYNLWSIKFEVEMNNALNQIQLPWK